jgi:uncharacterized repeat protein (TIGR03837 family)
MAQRHAAGRAPAWINLEYLSAEPYAERSHRLLSPQLAGAGAGLRKQFFFPGFSARTGGLLREGNLELRQSRFDAGAWRVAHGLQTIAGERVVCLFCYDGAPLAELIDALSSRPTLLVATHGVASQLVSARLGPTLRTGALRAVRLPALSQPEFDHLLWSCDINFVRGEDSLVRAIWSGRPFVWHIYPQSDQAHASKLRAFNSLYLQDADSGLASDYYAMSSRWNGLATGSLTLPPIEPWHSHAKAWRGQLLRHPDLVTQLVSELRAMAAGTS